MKHQCKSMFNCSCGNPLWKSIIPSDFNIEKIKTTSKNTTLASHIFQATDGGIILTLRNGRQESVEAIAIDQGKIIAVGTLEHVHQRCDELSIEVGEPIKVTGTKALLPAFIEPHTHIIPSALLNTGVDLSPFQDQKLREDYTQDWVIDQLADAQRKVCEDFPEAEWANKLLVGHNVDPSLFTGEDKTFNADVLDTKVKDVPAIIFNTSGHLAYINQPAIEKLSHATPPIITNPDGILAEFAEMLPVFKVLIEGNKPTQEQVEDEIKAIFKTTVERGATYMLDAALDKAQIDILEKIAADESCPVRIGGAYLIENLSMLKSEVIGKYQPNGGDQYFNLAFLKLISDGSAQGLTAYQYTPYDCDENYNQYTVDTDGTCSNNARLQNNNGLFNFGYPVEFNALLATANDNQWPTMIHANGDHAIDRTLSAFKAANINNSTINQRRDRIEHCSLLTEKTMDQMTELGISPSFTIGHVGYWGWHFQNTIIGKQRADQLDLCRSALDKHNMRITLHSDYSVTPLGALRMMEQSITRLTEDAPNQNQEQHVLNADERLTPFQALKAMTYDAAWQCHVDQWVGSLEVGKCADFIILAQSPLTYQNEHDKANPAAGMRDIPVLQTWKGGKLVYAYSEANECTHN